MTLIFSCPKIIYIACHDLGKGDNSATWRGVMCKGATSAKEYVHLTKWTVHSPSSHFYAPRHIWYVTKELRCKNDYLKRGYVQNAHHQVNASSNQKKSSTMFTLREFYPNNMYHMLQWLHFAQMLTWYTCFWIRKVCLSLRCCPIVFWQIQIWKWGHFFTGATWILSLFFSFQSWSCQLLAMLSHDKKVVPFTCVIFLSSSFAIFETCPVSTLVDTSPSPESR